MIWFGAKVTRQTDVDADERASNDNSTCAFWLEVRLEVASGHHPSRIKATWHGALGSKIKPLDATPASTLSQVLTAPATAVHYLSNGTTVPCILLHACISQPPGRMSFVRDLPDSEMSSAPKSVFLLGKPHLDD